MAVGTWQIHDKFKRVMADGTLDLDNGSHELRCSLYKGSSNLGAAAISGLSVIGSVTNELADGNGYSTSGKTLSADWTQGASGGEMRFSHSDVFWSATGDITSIQYAVAWFSGASANARYILGHCTLSTSVFTLTSTNRLTISDGGNGVFELN